MQPTDCKEFVPMYSKEGVSACIGALQELIDEKKKAVDEDSESEIQRAEKFIEFLKKSYESEA